MLRSKFVLVEKRDKLNMLLLEDAVRHKYGDKQVISSPKVPLLSDTLTL